MALGTNKYNAQDVGHELDRLPEDLIEVNGFRLVRSSEHFAEWRDVGSDRVAYVYVMYESTPSYPSGWVVEYQVEPRRGNGIEDSGLISEHRGPDLNDAVHDAVAFMRHNGSGERDLSGGISAGVPADLDFTGAGR